MLEPANNRKAIGFHRKNYNFNSAWEWVILLEINHFLRTSNDILLKALRTEFWTMQVFQIAYYQYWGTREKLKDINRQKLIKIFIDFSFYFNACLFTDPQNLYYVSPWSWFMIHVMAAVGKPIDLERILHHCSFAVA